MKKILFAVFFTLVFSVTSLSADGQVPGTFKFAFTGGGGMTVGYGDLEDDYESEMTGTYFGGFSGYYAYDDMISFFAGLDYAKRPYKIKYDNGTTTGKSKINASFMDINAGLRFTNFQGFFFEAGPFIGVPVGDWKYDNSGSLEGGDDKVPGKYSKVEVGLSVGGGYLLSLSETVDISLGVFMKGALTKGYDDGDTKLSSRMLGAKLGVEVKF